eukprot:365298-Chlamydomonas_euryale.AAC.12
MPESMRLPGMRGSGREGIGREEGRDTLYSDTAVAAVVLGQDCCAGTSRNDGAAAWRNQAARASRQLLSRLLVLARNIQDGRMGPYPATGPLGEADELGMFGPRQNRSKCRPSKHTYVTGSQTTNQAFCRAAPVRLCPCRQRILGDGRPRHLPPPRSNCSCRLVLRTPPTQVSMTLAHLLGGLHHGGGGDARSARPGGGGDGGGRGGADGVGHGVLRVVFKGRLLDVRLPGCATSPATTPLELLQPDGLARGEPPDNSSASAGSSGEVTLGGLRAALVAAAGAEAGSAVRLVLPRHKALALGADGAETTTLREAGVPLGEAPLLSVSLVGLTRSLRSGSRHHVRPSRRLGLRGNRRGPRWAPARPPVRPPLGSCEATSEAPVGLLRGHQSSPRTGPGTFPLIRLFEVCLLPISWDWALSRWDKAQVEAAWCVADRHAQCGDAQGVDAWGVDAWGVAAAAWSVAARGVDAWGVASRYASLLWGRQRRSGLINHCTHA